MLPTFGGNPGILYCSYTYIDSENIKIGDVVIVVPLNYKVDRNNFGPKG